MKTLHLYLTRQMLATLGMTVFVFTLVLLLGNVIREVLRLVANHQATLSTTLHAIALLIPYVLAFSMPIGMLTAALLVFGRFSADQELTAARASGISLLALITPVLLLSVAVSAICGWLNFYLAPSCRMAYKELIFHAMKDHPSYALQSNQSVQFGDNIIYVGEKRGTNLENVIVSEYDLHSILKELIYGKSGYVTPDPANNQIILTLHDGYSMRHDADGWIPGSSAGDATFPVKIPAAAGGDVPMPPSDMTFEQLMDRRDEIERELSVSPAAGKKTRAELLEVRRRFKEMSNNETTPILVYLNRQVAFSFACIGFTLLGIPLGIRAHRRETSVGVATALILMLIYYSFVVLAQAWTSHPERAPYLIVWIPDFIFQAVGAVLLWRANRGI
jgi:lipopolysaccharide export system permease protein